MQLKSSIVARWSKFGALVCVQPIFGRSGILSELVGQPSALPHSAMLAPTAAGAPAAPVSRVVQKCQRLNATSCSALSARFCASECFI
tara:strand:- start:1893 stop:2156 length:264 start_codon:yes stop_codon:yes gene_type:complete